MKIAKINGNTIEHIGTTQELFPNTSFVKDIITDDFLELNSCMRVVESLQFNSSTHKQVVLEVPRIEDRIVYTTELLELTDDEKQQLQIEKIEQLKQLVNMNTNVKIDAFARNLGYDSMLSLISYQTSTNPKYAEEANRGINYRDSIWLVAEKLVSNAVDGGIVPSSDEIIDILSNVV